MKTEKEKKLIKALEETLWMANRYSSGRLSYAPSMFKDAFNSIKDLLNPIEIKRIEKDKVIEEIRKDVEEERKELKEAGKAEAIKQIEIVYKKLFCRCSKMKGVCRSCDDWELVKSELGELAK